MPKKKEIKIGDFVKVIDSGDCFTTHPDATKELQAPNYDYRVPIKNRMIGMIYAINGGHGTYVVERKGKHYLIKFRGVVLHKKGCSSCRGFRSMPDAGVVCKCGRKVNISYK